MNHIDVLLLDTAQLPHVNSLQKRHTRSFLFFFLLIKLSHFSVFLWVSPKMQVISLPLFSIWSPWNIVLCQLWYPVEGIWCNRLNRLYENPVSIKYIAALLLSVTFRLKKEGKMTYGQALDMYAVFASILYFPPAFSTKKHPCGCAALNLAKHWVWANNTVLLWYCSLFKRSNN